jgi:hypothetical protein
MAAGDIFASTPTTIGNNATWDIKTTGSAEAIVNNIYTDMGSCELYKYDGITLSKSDIASGWLNYKFRVSATNYIQIKNVSGGNLDLSHDGIYTKA